MDCKIARLLLDFTRPGRPELERPEAQALEEHLADCPECRSLARAERQVDERLGQAMRAVPVPEILKARLLSRLATRRRAWYRRQIVRGVAALAAGAAVVVLAVWLGPVGKPAHVNLEEAWMEVSQQKGAPPDRVQEWFQDTYHVHTVPPTNFNYAWLAFYDLAEFQGRRVPFLFFVRGEHTARLYILSAAQFDLENVVEQPGYNIQLLRPPADDKNAYVAVFSSDRLDWFLQRDRATDEIPSAQ
jgi:hypothetical protein